MLLICQHLEYHVWRYDPHNDDSDYVGDDDNVGADVGDAVGDDDVGDDDVGDAVGDDGVGDDGVGDAVGDNRNLFVMFHGSSPVLLLLGKLMLSWTFCLDSYDKMVMIMVIIITMIAIMIILIITMIITMMNAMMRRFQ